jgi:hypothetical protein
MKVIAKELGFYGHKRIRPGQKFTLVPKTLKDKDGKAKVISAEDQFSAKWMRKEGEPELDESEESFDEEEQPEPPVASSAAAKAEFKGKAPKGRAGKAKPEGESVI